MSDANQADLSSMLDLSLDELEDLPSFEPPLPGLYRLSVSLGTKPINGSIRVTADFKVLEALESADPAVDISGCVGRDFNLLFDPYHKIGSGMLKKFAAPFSAATGVSKIGELISAVQGTEVTALVTNRADPKDATRIYAGVDHVTIL